MKNIKLRIVYLILCSALLLFALFMLAVNLIMKKWRPRGTDTSCICLRNDFRCIHIKRKSRTAILQKNSRLFLGRQRMGRGSTHLRNPFAMSIRLM